MRRIIPVLLATWVFVGVIRDSNAQSNEAIVVDSAMVRLIEEVEAPARAEGVLVAVAVQEGQAVDKGALLAQIDNAEAELLYQRAAVELQLSRERATDDVPIRAADEAIAFARGDLKRIEQAQEKLPGSVSIAELEEARLRLRQAELQHEKAERELKERQLEAELALRDLELSQHDVDIRRIDAPTPGVVVEILRRPGEWVEPGDAVLRILRIDPLRVEGLVPIGDLRSELSGASAVVSVTLPGRGDIERTGKVTFVSPEVNAVNGQVRIWVEMDNPDGLVRPGLRATMTITPKAAD